MRFTPMSQARNTMGYFAGVPVFTGTDWINMGPDNRRYKAAEIGAAAVQEILASMTAAQLTQLQNQDDAFAATGYIGPIAGPGNPPVVVNIPQSAYGVQTIMPDYSYSNTGNLYTAAEWIGLGPAGRDAVRPTLTQAEAQAIWNSMTTTEQAAVTAANTAWAAQGNINHAAGSALPDGGVESSTSAKLLKYGALALTAFSLFK